MIGERLKQLRCEVFEMNQSEFANMIGLTQGALSSIEKGLRPLPFEALRILAEKSASDVRIDLLWILTGNESAGLNTQERKLLSSFRRLSNHDKQVVEKFSEMIEKMISADEM